MLPLIKDCLELTLLNNKLDVKPNIVISRNEKSHALIDKDW